MDFSISFVFFVTHFINNKCIKYIYYAVLESIDYTFIINIAIIFNKGIKLGQNTTLHALLTCKKKAVGYRKEFCV